DAHAWVVDRVIDVLRRARLEDAADHPLAERECVGLQLFCDRSTPDDRLERPAIRLDEIDGTRLTGKEVDRVLGDALEDSGRIERRGDLATDVGERRHLTGSALRLAVEPRVLDRDADVRGDRVEEP